MELLFAHRFDISTYTVSEVYTVKTLISGFRSLHSENSNIRFQKFAK